MTDVLEPESKRPSKSTVLLSILRESASVIAAILLALAINEWWEDHEREQRKAKLLDRLYIEMAENLELLKAAHEHHSSHLEFIRAETNKAENLSAEDYQRIFTAMYRKGIMRPALLTDANWEIAKLTNLISYIELEQLSALIKVYALFETHETRWQQNGDAQTLINLEEDPEKVVGVYFDILNETWWIERSLIATIESLLEGRKVGDQPWEG